MVLYYRYGYGSPRFLEVAQGFHPRGIPRSEARGGGAAALQNVKRYLAKMDKAVDYDYYYADELRYTRFKLPFDRRPLIGRRTRHRKNEGKRTLRGSASSGAAARTTCGSVRRLNLVISTAMTGRTNCRRVIARKVCDPVQSICSVCLVTVVGLGAWVCSIVGFICGFSLAPCVVDRSSVIVMYSDFRALCFRIGVISSICRRAAEKLSRGVFY